jgi:hypothetical protein
LPSKSLELLSSFFFLEKKEIPKESLWDKNSRPEKPFPPLLAFSKF